LYNYYNYTINNIVIIQERFSDAIDVDDTKVDYPTSDNAAPTKVEAAQTNGDAPNTEGDEGQPADDLTMDSGDPTVVFSEPALNDSEHILGESTPAVHNSDSASGTVENNVTFDQLPCTRSRKQYITESAYYCEQQVSFEQAVYSCLADNSELVCMSTDSKLLTILDLLKENNSFGLGAITYYIGGMVDWGARQWKCNGTLIPFPAEVKDGTFNCLTLMDGDVVATEDSLL